MVYVTLSNGHAQLGKAEKFTAVVFGYVPVTRQKAFMKNKSHLFGLISFWLLVIPVSAAPFFVGVMLSKAYPFMDPIAFYMGFILIIPVYSLMAKMQSHFVEKINDEGE